MEDRELGRLLTALFNKSIGKNDLDKLGLYLLNLLRNAADHLAEDLRKKKEIEEVPASLFSKLGSGEEERKELLQEFIAHLISKSYYFHGLLEKQEGTKAYLWRVAKNFMIDTWRKQVKRDITTESIDKETEEDKAKDIRDETYLLNLEILEVEDLVRSAVSEEDFKYLCYFLNSERYMCLWNKKSKDAIYKEVSRKKDRVLQKLGQALSENGVSEELFKDFVRVRLSGICEDLRSKYCKEKSR